MLAIPKALNDAYDNWLNDQKISKIDQPHYKKWLRYYRDFCHKNSLDLKDKNNFPAFNQKLAAKGQSDALRQQAHHAVSLYYTLMRNKNKLTASPENKQLSQEQMSTIKLKNNLTMSQSVEEPIQNYPIQPITSVQTAVPTQQPIVNIVKSPHKTNSHSQQSSCKNVSWVWVYDKLSTAIKVRHYSPRTLKSYQGWVRKIQAFTQSKDAHLLDMEDVKAFLSDLTVRHQVAASTQNQAFNALLFLFRHVLET